MAYRKNKDGISAYYYEKRVQKQSIIQEDWFKEHGYKRGADQYPTAFYEHIESELSPGRRAYWALAIDGDGCLSRSARPQNRMTIGLTAREPIQYLADLYGVSISRVQYTEKEEWKDLYQLALYGKRCSHFIKLICPYMIEKKQEVLKMINEEDPGYHPPKIPMNFKKYPGLITIHMGMVAGFFDTEGSVGIQARVTAYKTKTKGTQFYNSLNQWIHFTNTNLRPLRKIKKILESWPFHFTPTIYRDNSKMLDKKGKLQKVRYKLKLPNSQHRLFMAMFGPIIMIGAKRQLDRFDDLAFVDKRFFQSGKWNKKKRKSWSTHTF